MKSIFWKIRLRETLYDVQCYSRGYGGWIITDSMF